MHCPKDRTICVTRHLDGIDIDVCPLCQGVWLEKKEVRHVIRKLSVPKNTSIDEILDKWDDVESKGSLPKDFWSEDDLECPIDRIKMKKHYFAGSNIGVDQCHVCMGFWFDGGELQAVAKYVEPNPDLDIAWQSLLREEKKFNRQLDEMKLIPSQIASFITSFANPPVALALLGGFLLKTAAEIIIKEDNIRDQF